ncbi:hypothetical protein HanRHA438_Chr16g0757881 [Helianthus annuus]|nr:hypothetical protein HanRHA438_Chr16g0757881 [Helianthus annuus]
MRFMLILIHILLIRFYAYACTHTTSTFMIMLIHTCVFILKLMLILSSILMIIHSYLYASVIREICLRGSHTYLSMDLLTYYILTRRQS